jgi:hypothetical protein
MIVVPLAALAQQGTSEIRGRVRDAQGAAVPGAVVTVRNQDTGMYRETTSQNDGAYFVTSVVPGRYEVMAQLQGFKKFRRGDLLLEVGKTVTADIALEVGSLEESVDVTAESPLVDVTSKEVGGNISRELVELPSINRNFIGFIGLLPGVVPNISSDTVGSDSININGMDSRNNNYLLDGANNYDDFNGGRSGTQARTPLESIQEFQVILQQFDAEFGRSTGAIINAVTRQGSNSFHGSAFGYFQDASLTQKSYFSRTRNLPKPDTRNQQFGGTLGGPVVRDKAHFFASVERIIGDRGFVIVIPTRPDLNWSTTTKDRILNTLVRFDHQISARHTWGVRWLRDDQPSTNQITGTRTPSAVDQENDVDQTVVGTLTSALSDRSVNTLRVSFTQEDVTFGNPGYFDNGGRQDQLPVTLVYQSFTDQQSARASARINNAYQIEETFSRFLPDKSGDHDIKLGVHYQHSTVQNFNAGNLNGTFTFGRNDMPFNPADPRTYPDRFSIRVGGPQDYTQKVQFVAAFAQDKWKVNSRLTLSLGVRYDVEVFDIPEDENPRFSGRGGYPVDKNNVAPRLGFAYDVGGGRAVVRGGYGMFYDRSALELFTGFYTGGLFSNSFTANFPLTAADAGPRNGRMPTDPTLVNGPFLTPALRAYVNSIYPPGTRLRNTGGVSLDNPERRTPYTHQATLGFEKQLGRDFSVSADYVHVASRAMLMTQDLNKGTRPNTAVTTPVVRPDPGFQAINTPVNVGRMDHDGLNVQLEKRLSKGYSFRASYGLGYARGNTSAVGIPGIDRQVGQDLNLDKNEGPTNNDRRHNFVLSGTAEVPYTRGLTLSGVARYLSGTGFTLVNNDIDADRNGTQFDPIAAGRYQGNGRDPYEVQFDGGRNGARGPNFFQIDARVGYRARLAGKRLDVFADVFNVANRANFATPSGNQASPNFLLFTALTSRTAPRTFQLGARLQF